MTRPDPRPARIRGVWLASAIGVLLAWIAFYGLAGGFR